MPLVHLAGVAAHVGRDVEVSSPRAYDAAATPAIPSGHTVESNLPLLQTLIKKALEGTLARDREPSPWAPSVLSEVHIQMIMERAAGSSPTEIAEKWDYTMGRVCTILAHPDAQTLLSTLLSMQADRLTDMSARLEALAPEALNVKVSIMRDAAVPAAVRDRVTSDILDRAGYAPRRKLDVTTDTTTRILLPAQAATGLKEALLESMRVSTVDYSRFLQKPQQDEVAAVHLQIGDGHSDSADGASPGPSTEAPVQEREREVA